MRNRIATALKEAMKNKEAERLSTLRLINAAIKDMEISKRGGEGADIPVSDEEILQILGRMVKQRKESARTYEEGGRLDLAEREMAEIAIIEEFLPKQLSDDEIDCAISAAIAETGSDSIRDMGKVMGALKSKFTGQMDFSLVGPMVRNKLS